MPGFVRLSFAIYNTKEEVDYFIHALKEIITKGPSATYEEDPHTGEYSPRDYHYNYAPYFPINRNQ